MAAEFLNNLFIDPTILPQDGFGLGQLCMLGAGYGYVLLAASNMISDGSEILLLTSWKDLVGPVVLPILGAIPDGAMIMFSGSSQKQLAVGVGALAGSTIMLLTIPWGLASISGRVNWKNDREGNPTPKPKYPSRPPRCDEGSWISQLCTTGVSVDESISGMGWFMLFSSIPYLVIQIPAFGFHCAEYDCGCDHNDTKCLEGIAEAEKPWALAGLIMSVVFFVAYLLWQYNSSEAKKAQGKKDGGPGQRSDGKANS